MKGNAKMIATAATGSIFLAVLYMCIHVKPEHTTKLCNLTYLVLYVDIVFACYSVCDVSANHKLKAPFHEVV